MSERRRGGIFAIVLGVLAGVIAIFAYTQEFYLELWHFLPLNHWALAVLGVVLVAVGIVLLVAPGAGRPSAANADELFNGFLTDARQMTASSQPMQAPCALNIWEPAGALRQARIGVNGYPVGELAAGNGLTTQTQVTQNILTVLEPSTGNVVNAPFTAVPGGVVNLAITVAPSGSILLGQS
jgi:hypothetical protein